MRIIIMIIIIVMIKMIRAPGRVLERQEQRDREGQINVQLISHDIHHNELNRLAYTITKHTRT